MLKFVENLSNLSIKPALLLIAASLISSCGIAQVNEFEKLSAQELALKSDEFICDAGARIQILSKLPPVWIRELKNRDLWECVSEYRQDAGTTRVIIQTESKK